MKIPKIHGRNRIRDTKICKLFVQDLIPSEQIAERFKITVRRVYQILYDNREFLKFDTEYEKLKRILWLKKQVGDRKSKKDPAELIDMIRKEIEGDKPLIDQSQHSSISIVVKELNAEDIRTHNRTTPEPIEG